MGSALSNPRTNCPACSTVSKFSPFLKMDTTLSDLGNFADISKLVAGSHSAAVPLVDAVGRLP